MFIQAVDFPFEIRFIGMVLLRDGSHSGHLSLTHLSRIPALISGETSVISCHGDVGSFLFLRGSLKNCHFQETEKAFLSCWLFRKLAADQYLLEAVKNMLLNHKKEKKTKVHIYS